jgi:hypothetical protein
MIRTKLYHSLLFGGLAAIILGSFAPAREKDTAIWLYFGGTVASILGAIAGLVILYRVWCYVIKESQANNLTPSIKTPGQAVGFLFIPFYNLYWVFVAFGRLPHSLNALSRARGSRATASTSLGIVLALLTILGVIPFIGIIPILIVNFIVEPVFLNDAVKLCRELDACRPRSSV